MTPDGAIDVAQEALSRNNPAFASELYEFAARALLDSDEKRAASLLKLTSDYVEVGDRRQGELAAEAQRILEIIGDHGDEITDLLLGREATAQQGGQFGRAHRLYVECVRRLAQKLEDTADPIWQATMSPHLLARSSSPLVKKMRYCSDRARELEGRS